MKLKELIENPINLQRPEGVSNKQWVRALQLYEAAKNVGDKFPELTVAQAALETGWFKKESGKNNFFGQKASKSQEGSSVATHEVINGERIAVQDRFRDYDSIENALLDRKDKWMSKYANASTPQEAISKIWRYDNKKKQGVGYATDPEYGKKVNTILNMMGVNPPQDGSEVKQPKIPPLATPPINPNYAVLPEAEKQEARKEQTISEEQIRTLLAQERQAIENKFLNAFQQQKTIEEIEYSPQQQEEDLSYLYDYIDIENFADGGSYTVKKGDSLSKIAKDNNLSVEEILSLNESYKSNPNLLQVGDNILLSKTPDKVSLFRPSTYTETRGEIASSVPKRSFKYNPNFSNKELPKLNYEEIVSGNKSESVKKEVSNKEDRIKLQQELLDAGYDLGNTGKNKDGVDGVVGPKTKKAQQEYLNAQQRFSPLTKDTDIIGYQEKLQEQGMFKGIDYREPKDRYQREDGKTPFSVNPESKCTSKYCTAYVGQEINKNIGSGEDKDDKRGGRRSLDAYGDAWTYNERIVNSGGKEVFSIFEDKKPSIKGGAKEIENYIQNKIDSTDKLDVNKVQEGDTLNIFYPGSAFAEQAYKEGSKYFTSHAGIVKKDRSGSLIVEHNVGGRVYKSPLSDFAEGKAKNKAGKTMAITAVVRPDYKDLKAKTSNEGINKTNVLNNDSSLYNENYNKFSRTLEENKNELIKDAGLSQSEFKNIDKALRAIAWKESDYGDASSPLKMLRDVAGEVREYFGGKEKSRGLTSLKDENNLPSNLRNKYVKGKGKNLNNPSESAIASFYALTARYKYLKDLRAMEKLKVSDEELSKLAMLGWNEDIANVGKSLEKYRNFEETMKAYRGEDEAHPYDLAMVAYEDYLK